MFIGPFSDDGYVFVGLHYSINKPLHDVGAGDWNFDVHDKEGLFVNLHVERGMFHIIKYIFLSNMIYEEHLEIFYIIFYIILHNDRRKKIKVSQSFSNMRPHSSKMVSHTFFRFYKAHRLFFWTSFFTNTPTNMPPSCAENNFDIINDMYSSYTSSVMSNVSFLSCRSI